MTSIINSKFIGLALAIFTIFALVSCQNKSQHKSMSTQVEEEKKGNPYYSLTSKEPLQVSDAEWKKVLSPDVYAIMREKDTERPFTGKYWNYVGKGTYHCASCGNKLFRSDAKFASMCGWPSFFEQEDKKSIVFKDDFTHGMQRIETLCGRCNGHLGHIFDDGPEPTGKRYCMNSIALDFIPDDKTQL